MSKNTFLNRKPIISEIYYQLPTITTTSRGLFINNIHLSYVTIPFKIFREQEPSTYTSIEDFFTYQSDLKYYGQISIGEKESPIPIIFSFDDFGFYFISNGTDLGDTVTSYNPSYST